MILRHPAAFGGKKHQGGEDTVASEQLDQVGMRRSSCEAVPLPHFA